MFTTEIFNVKDKLPDVERGSFLVYAPKSFPKNSRWLVAEYYYDVKGFYCLFRGMGEKPPPLGGDFSFIGLQGQ